MVDVHPTLYTFLLELVVVLIVIVAWFLTDTIKRRNRDRKVVSIIIAKVKQGAQSRKDAVKTFLGKVYKLEGDELDENSDKLLKQENNFFQIFVNLYLKRDGRMAASITDLIKNLLLPYHQPEQLIGEERIKQLMVTEEVVSSDPEDKNLIEQLKQQNQRLIKENNKLHVEIATTGQTLEQMLGEYSRAFDNGEGRASASIKPVKPSVTTSVMEKSQAEQQPVDQEPVDQEALAAAWAAETEGVGEGTEDEDAPVDQEALASAWSTEVSLDDDKEAKPVVR